MKKGIVIFAICIFAFCICSGCGKKTEKQTETAGKDGLVTMSADLTEDDSTTLACTIVNKTKKDIMIGEEYSLQVLKDKSFVDEAGRYRIVKEYTNEEKGSRKKENAGKETVSAEFDLS